VLSEVGYPRFPEPPTLVVGTGDGCFRLRCGPHVARANLHPERTEHDYIETRTSVMRTRRPSTVLEMFWSDVATSRGIPVCRRRDEAYERETEFRRCANSPTPRSAREWLATGLNAYITTPTPPARNIRRRCGVDRFRAARHRRRLLVQDRSLAEVARTVS
jgi:hypothetical protein